MAEPFIGEIRSFAFGVVPDGWAPCNGQLLPIAQNQALYAILGNTYGGDGRTTFALPNLQGRAPVHPGGGVTLGQSAGEETHVLTVNEMPMHNHSAYGSSDASSSDPTNNAWGTTNFAPPINNYGTTLKDRKSTRLNSSHIQKSRMPSSA